MEKEEFDLFVQRNVANRAKVTSKIIRQGIYYEDLKAWKNEFGQRLLILNGENFIRTPGALLEDIQKFLGIPILIKKEDFVKNHDTQMYCLRKVWLYPNEQIHCMPSKKGRTRSNKATYNMTRKTATILRTFYQPYNEKLYELLGYRFDW